MSVHIDPESLPPDSDPDRTDRTLTSDYAAESGPAEEVPPMSDVLKSIERSVRRSLADVMAERDSLAMDVKERMYQQELLHRQIGALALELNDAMGNIDVLRTDLALRDAEIVQLRAEIDRLHGRAEPDIADIEGRVVVSWPRGRGPTMVMPEIIDGWADGINMMRAEIERLRELLETARRKTLPGHTEACGGVIESEYERGRAHALDDVYRVVREAGTTPNDDPYLVLLRDRLEQAQSHLREALDGWEYVAASSDQAEGDIAHIGAIRREAGLV